MTPTGRKAVAALAELALDWLADTATEIRDQPPIDATPIEPIEPIEAEPLDLLEVPSVGVNFQSQTETAVYRLANIVQCPDGTFPGEACRVLRQLVTPDPCSYSELGLVVAVLLEYLHRQGAGPFVGELIQHVGDAWPPGRPVSNGPAVPATTTVTSFPADPSKVKRARKDKSVEFEPDPELLTPQSD